MKTKGTIIVTPLMSDMKEGQKGYLTTDAIVVINGNMVVIATGYSISEIKQDKYVLPIERTGTGNEDYEIDFNVARTFFNTNMSEEEIQKLKDSPNFIGPYPIVTEIVQPLNYREQAYPRMDLYELLEAFLQINQSLEDNPDNEMYMGDKKTLRKLIKGKLKELSLEEIRNYQNYFAPLNKEESNDGEIVNYAEDENIMNFVQSRIEELEQEGIRYEKMSIDELEKEKIKATNESKFELAGRIRDIIILKKQKITSNNN